MLRPDAGSPEDLLINDLDDLRIPLREDMGQGDDLDAEISDEFSDCEDELLIVKSASDKAISHASPARVQSALKICSENSYHKMAPVVERSETQTSLIEVPVETCTSGTLSSMAHTEESLSEDGSVDNGSPRFANVKSFRGLPRPFNSTLASPVSVSPVHFPDPTEVPEVFVVPRGRCWAGDGDRELDEAKTTVFNPFEMHSARTPSSRILHLENELHVSSAVELSIDCENVPRMDLFTPNALFAVVLTTGMARGEWDEFDRTEIICSAKSPQFVRKIRLPACSASDRAARYKVQVYHKSPKVSSLSSMEKIAESDFSVDELLREKQLRVQKELVSERSKRTRGRMRLTLDTIAHESTTEWYTFDFGFLPNAPRRNRIIYVLARGQRLRGQFLPVYRSEVRRSHELESFNAAQLNSQEIHGGEPSRLFRLEVYRYYKSGETSLLGFIQTSVQKLKECRDGAVLYWWPGVKGLHHVRVILQQVQRDNGTLGHEFRMRLASFPPVEALPQMS